MSFLTKGVKIMRLHIKKLATQNDVSIKEVAEAVGVKPGRLYQLNIGQGGEPSIGLLQKLSDYFAITIDELIILNHLWLTPLSKKPQ